MASSSPYQGYPYVNRQFIDPPSISASDAARWSNLPRRQVELNVKKHDPTNTPSVEDSSFPEKRESNPAVVYIDMPEASGSDVVNRPQLSPVSPRADPDDDDPVPVVYIDMPDLNGSSVAFSTTTTPQNGPAFIQETIFYNQFDNKMINRTEDSDDEEELPHNHSIPARRPDTLNLHGAGGAGTSAGGSTTYPGSSAVTKEADIYGNRDSAGFPLPSIPASQFPQPPPSYDDIDNIRPVVTTVESPVVTTVEPPRTIPTTPPRTLVILPGDAHHNYTTIQTTPMGVSNPDRKYMICHHCGAQVQTLVVKENGMFTYLVGFACLIICMPCVLCIFCTDWFKVKNHYCPNCNKVIGYEQPFCNDTLMST